MSRIDGAALHAWFDTHGRDLPWRRDDRTGWGVLVSEVMLQQTPVARVLDVWRAWLGRWSRPSALAGASQGEVLRAWGKLGYPRRALRLHSAAGTLAEQHDDVVPSEVETLESLPGIGFYTARAVAAFAYGAPVPVVDTNVRRVLARARHGNAAAPAHATAGEADEVRELLPASRPAEFSAALMELGALVCTARTPRCGQCPLAAGCAWLRAGKPAAAGPARRPQRFAGTDRQVRGRLLDVLRGTAEAVDKANLDLAWPHEGQRDRCLASLLDDGLVEQKPDGAFCLPGEH